MKKFWKIVAPVTATVLIGCITLTSVTFFSEREKVEAGEEVSFKGIEDIVERSKTEPFEIWELVPDTKMGEFAHMFDETILTNWKEELKTIQKKADRKSYMENLKEKWYGLYNCSKGNETYQALQYNTYKDQYALGENENEGDFTVLELAGGVDRSLCDDLLGSTEYKLVDQKGNPGEYRRERFYSISQEDGVFNGDYIQKVDYYVYSKNKNAYYSVAFQGLDTSELKNIDGELFAPDGQTIYEATDSLYIADENTFNEIRAKNENAYVYRLSYANVYGGYEFVGKKISELNYENDIKADIGKYYYYTVTFKYVQDGKPLSENTNYYVIQKDRAPEFLVNYEDGNYVGAGEYAANLAAEYVPVESGKGYFKQTEQDCFLYVGKDKGTHNLVKADNPDGLEVRVIPGKIYYQGGFTNNRLLEKYVFGAKRDEMSFSYRVVDPALLNQQYEELEHADLLYISSKSLTYEKENGGEASGFTKENDIDWETTALKILTLAKQKGKRLPIIVDQSIINTNEVKNYDELEADGESYKYTNMQRLVALLASKELFNIPVSQSKVRTDDTFQMLDFEHWRSGRYGDVNEDSFSFEEDDARLCLKNYQSVDMYQTFTAHISNPNLRLSVKEISRKRDSVLAKHILADGESFTIQSDSTFGLAVTLYDGSTDNNTPKVVTYDGFKELFDNEEEIYLEGSDKLVSPKKQDLFAMTDFNNWVSGYYNENTGEFEEKENRIALKTMRTPVTDLKYRATIGNKNVHILVRCLAEDLSMVESYNLSDGDTFTPRSNTKYLAISLYNLLENDNVAVSKDTYGSLFENGYYAYLEDARNPREEVPYYQEMLDFNNWRLGHYDTNGVYSCTTVDGKKRISLNHYISVEPGKKFWVYISTKAKDVRMIARQYDKNYKLISAYPNALANGQSFTTEKNVEYLGISLYGSNNSVTSFEGFETLYKNGFVAYIIDEETLQELNDPFHMEESINWRTGQYTKENGASGKCEYSTWPEHRCCYKEIVDVLPGEKYIARFNRLKDLNSKDKNLKLSIRKLNKDGKVIDKDDVVVLGDGDAIVIPDNVKKLAVILNDDRDGTGAAVDSGPQNWQDYVNLFNSGFRVRLEKDPLFVGKQDVIEQEETPDSDVIISVGEGTKISEIPWKDLTYKKNCDTYGYVNNNVYVYPCNNKDDNNESGTPFIFKKFSTLKIVDSSSESTFLEDAQKLGFGEIAEFMNAENLNRTNENKGLSEGQKLKLFDLYITKATIVEYIINYYNRDEKVWSDAFRILEIQPRRTADKHPTLDAYVIKDLLKKQSINVNQVEITCMTSSEFIGKIEDLSQYDTIYFGKDTSYFNMKDGKTVYNDKNMNGLVYSNIGDINAFWTRKTKSVEKQDENGNPVYKLDKNGNKIIRYNGTIPVAKKDSNKNIIYTGRKDENGKFVLMKDKDGNPFKKKDADNKELDEYEKEYEVEYEKVYLTVYDWRTSGFDGLLDSDYFFDEQGQKTRLKSIFDDKNVNHTVPEYKEDATDAENDAYINADHTFRFSGNDITREKLLDVQKYVEAGYPVLVQDEYYKDKDGKKKGEVNGDLIDNCSNMYELLDSIKAEKEVLCYTEDGAYAKEWAKYLMLGKPELTISKHTKANYDNGAGKNFLDVKNNTVELGFRVDNRSCANPDAKYTFSFYLDVNSDGKFSETQEEVNPLNMIVKKNGRRIRVSSKRNSDNKLYYYYRIDPNAANEYTISYEVGEDTVGLIPYKLSIKQEDKLSRTVSKQGYFYNKHQGEKTTIHVLQIASGRGGNTFNMEDLLKNSNSEFAKLVNNVEDFKIQVRTISPSTYANEYAKNTKDYFSSCIKDKETNKQCAADMLVMGFADMYSINNKNGGMNGIVDYINAGNPVLFSHDTTSFFNDDILGETDKNNYTSFPAEWGYEFNRIVRNVVGMDRYGVLVNEEIKKGIELSETVNKESFDKAREYSEKNNIDIAYVPKSGKTKLAKQCQGFSYGSMQYYSTSNKMKDNISAECGGTGREYTVKKYWVFPDSKMRSGSYAQSTSQVKQINEGKITTYPYAVDKAFTATSTHYQYYQIDMNQDQDKDGKSDVVVWYTLENEGTTPYACSPGDVRNNYYIYTKGNITYSGVGHVNMKTDDLNELKLYVNTLVAAYSVGLKSPSISIKQKPEDDGENIDIVYASFDKTIDAMSENKPAEDAAITDAIENKVDTDEKDTNSLYLTLNDNNLVQNQSSSVAILTFAAETNITKEQYDVMSETEKEEYIVYKDSNGKELYLKKFLPDPPMKGIGVGAEEEKPISESDITKEVHLRSGITYQLDVPLSYLGNESYVNIYIFAKTRITQTVQWYNMETGKMETKELDPVDSPESVTSFRIQRIGLMDLD